MRAALSDRGALLGDFGVALSAALGGRPKRSRIDMLGRGRFPSAGATLDLDFVNQQGYAYGQGLGRIQDLVTISGGVGGTVVDHTGAIVAARAPRFDFDPVTLACRGLLVEEARTNLLLNSETLSTQSVTVTAAAHSLSFYGTGTITLSGTSTAGPAVGTGAYPTRTTLTFTPTAGALTLTVTGSVTSAQLEFGAFDTSHIPTTTAAVTRTVDSATSSGATFRDWFNAHVGTFIMEFRQQGVVATATYFGLRSIVLGTAFIVRRGADGGLAADWGGPSAATVGGPEVMNGFLRGAITYSVAENRKVLACNGVVGGPAAMTETSSTGIVLQSNSVYRRLRYYPRSLSNGELQELTR